MIHTRKRGPVFHIDCVVGESRLRGSLGTKDKTVAAKLRNRIEVAMAEGSKSRIWGELHSVLPADTFTRFASHSGSSRVYNPRWSGLVSIFRTDCAQRIQTKRLSPSSSVRYERTVSVFGEWLGSDAKLEDLTVAEIEKFKQWRLEQILTRENARGGKSLTLDVAVLHGVFKLAVEQGWLDKNPVWAEKINFDSTRGAQPFSGEELAKFRDACQTDEERLMYALFRYTGMRGSDVADLRRSEVHFLEREIVRRTAKRGVRVEIPMCSELAAALGTSRYLTDDHVLTVKNKSTTREQLYRLVRLIGCRAGIENAHPHRFRDTFCVDLLLKGATVVEIAKIVGDNPRTVEAHYLSFVAPLKNRIRTMMDDSTVGLESVQKMD